MAVVFLFAGCQKAPTGDLQPTVPAAGIVTYRGQPLEDYLVTFFPEKGRPAAGRTDATGQFRLGTNQPGDGAIVGRHVATFVYVGPPSTETPGKEEFRPPPPPKVVIPAKFGDPKTSGVVREIPSSGNSALQIELSQ
jgi:hypothetical protein